MTGWRVEAPSRLHFGPLSYRPGAARQFGGVGLMVRRPGLVVEARPAPEWSASGPLRDRAARLAEQVAARLVERRLEVQPLALRVVQAPAEHVGLGTGTQLALAVARLLARCAGASDLDAPELAAMTGRGARSGVGLHGFDHGGLIVEGGHGAGPSGAAPLLCRLDFPPQWGALVVVPAHPPGLHGAAEARAFAALPPMPDAETDRLCRLVLLGLLPAAAEGDLASFGQALEEIQRRVGAWFAPAQGGPFGSDEAQSLVGWLRARGLQGVGQSSWGPTLYGFTAEGPQWRDALARQLENRPGPRLALLWTTASRTGATFGPLA